MHEGSGSDYDCGWVVASAHGVGGTISNVGEAIETKNERR